MTRSEIEPIANAVRQLKKNYLFFEIAGSYRRYCKEINNLDVVVVGDTQPIINWLSDNTVNGVGGSIERLYTAEVAIKYGAMDKKGIATARVTFHIHTEDEWAAALLHWTGSVDFNRRLEEQAQSLGFTLDQNGLWQSEGERVPGVVNEASLFEALGMECVPPESRK